MKKYIAFAFFFLMLFSSREAVSQDFSLNDLTVIVTANIDNGNGYGIVIYEENDSLFITTALHLVSDVEGNFASNISLRFYKIDKVFKGEIEAIYKNQDLAILKVKKPKSYAWDYISSGADAYVSAKVGLIGRNNTWNPTRSWEEGVITFVNSDSFIAEFSGAYEGCSGGPVTNGTYIVGMITDDAGHLVKGVPLQFLKRSIINKRGIHDLPLHDLPYFSVDIFAELFTPLGTHGTPSLYKIPYGVGFEAGVWKNLSLRYAWSTTFIGSKVVSQGGYNDMFRNSLNSHSFSMRIYSQSGVLNGGSSYGLLGISLIKMHPQFNDNDEGWLDYNTISGLNISNKTYSIYIGVGGNQQFKSGVTIGYEMSLAIPESKFIAVDMRSPFDENQKRKPILSIGVNIGYSFFKKYSKIKLLRSYQY